MKKGTIISIIVAVLAGAGMVVAFLKNASPYVTIAQAKSGTSQSVHVVGDLDKATLQTNLREGQTLFAMSDEAGDRMNVRYTGAPIANMGDATRLVVVGTMKSDTFEADKVLVKCPSKYEGGEAPPVEGTK